MLKLNHTLNYLKWQSELSWTTDRKQCSAVLYWHCSYAIMVLFLQASRAQQISAAHHPVHNLFAKSFFQTMKMQWIEEHRYRNHFQVTHSHIYQSDDEEICVTVPTMKETVKKVFHCCLQMLNALSKNYTFNLLLYDLS